MPPPTISEVMKIPNYYSNVGSSVDSLADYLAKKQQMQEEFNQKVAFAQAQEQAHAQAETMMAKQKEDMYNKSPEGQMRARVMQHFMAAPPQQSPQAMPPQMPPQMPTTQSANFNPIMNNTTPFRSAPPAPTAMPQAQSANFNSMNPMARPPQAQDQQAAGMSVPKGFQYNPNMMFDRKADMFVKDESDAKSLAFSEKQDQFNQREWDKLVKDVDPLTTSGRNPLGMAMKANYNANRAIATLQNPMVTNQEAGNVMADIASIYQNGSPTQFGMAEQGYHTLTAKVASFKQYLTGKPQDALTPDIKNRLLDVLYTMKKTNFDVVRQNLDYTEKAKAKLIKNFPDEWQDMRKTMESDAYNGLDKQGQGGIEGLVPKQRPAGATHYSPSTKQFYDNQGNVVQ